MQSPERRQRDWLRLTAAATLAAVNPLVAWVYLRKLRSQGIAARIDRGAPTARATKAADARVLVAPEELSRARAVLQPADEGDAPEAQEERIRAETVPLFDPGVAFDAASASDLHLWLERYGIPAVLFTHERPDGGAAVWTIRIHPSDADAAHEVMTEVAHATEGGLPRLHFEAAGNWVAVALPADAGALDRAEGLLAKEEIPCRRKGDTLEVPSDVESDAIAVVAALDGGAADLPVDRPRELAELTESVTPDPLMPWPAAELAQRLTAAGIHATTDMPGQGLGFAFDVAASCRVRVRPEDLDRARAVAAGRFGDDAASREQVRANTVSILSEGRVLPDEFARPLDAMLRAAGVAGFWWPAEAPADDAAESPPGWEVRVAPGDLAEAQACLQRLSQAVHDTHAAPHPDQPPDPDAAQPLVPASLILFLVLLGMVYLLMKSCR